MDTSEFKEIFAAEARDYLQSLNDDLLRLENDPSNSDILDEMFRAAHSLKGMAGTMGFRELAEFTHEMESVFDLLRTGSLTATQEVVDVLFQAVDTLELLLEATIDGSPIAYHEQITQRLRSLTSAPPTPSSSRSVGELDAGFKLNEFDRETIKQGKEQGLNAYAAEVSLRPNTLLKSVRVFTVFQALENIGTIVKSDPPAQDLEEERFDLDFSLLILTRESAQTVQQVIEGISEIDAVKVYSINLEQTDRKSVV